MKKIFIFPLICSLVIPFLLHFPSANAAGVVGISIANPTEENKFFYNLELDPGDEFTSTVRVSNTTEGELPVKVYAIDAMTSAEGAFALKNLESEQMGFGSWTTMDSEVELVLDPNESRDIGFTMQLPEKVAPGEYAGGLVVETVPGGGGGAGAGAQISTRVGTRAYISVSGDIEVAFNWDEYSYAKQEGKHFFNYAFTNSGNVSVEAAGKILVKDMFGKTVEELDVDLGRMFPGDTTTPKIAWEKQPFMGKFSVETSVSHKRVSLKGDEEYDSETESKTLSFSVIPMALVGGIGVLILLIVAFLIWRKKKKKKKLIAGSMAPQMQQYPQPTPNPYDPYGQQMQQGVYLGAPQMQQAMNPYGAQQQVAMQQPVNQPLASPQMQQAAYAQPSVAPQMQQQPQNIYQQPPQSY